MENFDVVVIGAGIAGIAAAAHYLQAHPNARLVVLEQDTCLGGVWSQRRNYPGFWTQWAFSVAEYADMKMSKPPDDDYHHSVFRSIHTTKYLEDYVDHIRIAGSTLRDRMRFSTSVQSVTKVDGRWRIACTTSEGDLIVSAHRVMVANGQFSQPRVPDFLGRDTFTGSIIHSIDFGQCDVLTNSKIQHIMVLGGGKTSGDMVYEAVKAGKTVSWVIRETGPDSTGPGFFMPIDIPTGYGSAGIAAQTRVMSSLQPCYLLRDSWWTRFLHGTSIGVKLVKWVFGQAEAQMQKRAAYKTRPSTKGFEKLQPENEIFWLNGTGGVLHHDDFFELVAEHVNVYRAKVKKLTPTELYLDDKEGTHFSCDAVLCGTGWKSGLVMFSDDLSMELGLPFRKDLEYKDSKWKQLIEAADEKIVRRFPILRDPPPHPHISPKSTPYKLYQGIAPLHDDSIVFLGHVLGANNMLVAEVQAMWAVAHMAGNISMPAIEEREKEIATWLAWNRRRYLSNGELGIYMAFDQIPYVDTLLDQMGLSAHRQKGWLKDFFAPLWPSDVGKAWSEYLEKNRPVS
ncbi:flavin-binding monooxygenase-like protein-like protein [Lophiotrema nucula]|uniref:Flavin-binding monooxygenase-like protein-like protein n=1 Tax=Lophiotrema nucula TaxID=690887 RepID=A0A6A5YX40_9PLEO|nr:flavin-binding monooxygenase-like protein-like protein [Lophiotrema nucula]